ncbi:Glu-tRNA(Gln) amidotransferase subunit GatE [Candidatus Methanomassiliicoccus intestinalis]|uniref:Glu-tRNA(Gln) amidotransferase subunit GatE n=1 Tax=Candidatus Methanomassiliicoccus intestinalis TaxID=1406512 RepID=UPI0037DD1942
MSDEIVCGIEIHQQLDTKKLFCDCPTALVDIEGKSFFRRLRPVQSELGEIDRAALMQAEKKLRFIYQAPEGASCLVDADEEPPHGANKDALDIVLTVAALLNAQPVDEVHFMRKIVVDGSNTSGFQRTAMIAMDGYLDLNGKKISIPTFCLEEDAARKVETKDGEITYRLDRLGIPLIEIATGPDMHSAEEVKEVAFALGSIMRATRKVKRGIGTIREDLNISIPGGARVEIKGVQELRMLPLYVQNEADRQKSLLKIKDILHERKTKPASESYLDLTAEFKDCGSKIIAGALKKKGKVFAVALPGFSGVMKSPDSSLRLGAEMAGYAKTKGVAGIFHSDELPNYGITQEYVDLVRAKLQLSPEDAFALCADEEKKASAAIVAAVKRANMALEGVPEETRDPKPDGTSVYSRPLPGAARMYPETDVPPIEIGHDKMAKILANLPELPVEKAERIATQYSIHIQQSTQLVREGKDEVFEKVSSTLELSSVAARTLLSTLPELERDGNDVSCITDEIFCTIFECLSNNKFAKDAIPEILKSIIAGNTVESAIDEAGKSLITVDDAAKIVAKIVSERADFVKAKGLAAVGPLMGPLMAEMRGKIDGKQASELLKQEIEKFLG